MCQYESDAQSKTDLAVESATTAAVAASDIKTYRYLTSPVIRQFAVSSDESWVVPSQARLHIAGRFTKTDATLYSQEELTLLASKTMHMFRKAAYKINNLAVESVNWPGRCMEMFGHAPSVVVGENGSFSADISLDKIFGFCHDCKDPVYGLSHYIFFEKGKKSDIFAEAGIELGTAKFDEIVLNLPHTVPADEESAKRTIAQMKSGIDFPFEERQVYSVTKKCDGCLSGGSGCYFSVLPINSAEPKKSAIVSVRPTARSVTLDNVEPTSLRDGFFVFDELKINRNAIQVAVTFEDVDCPEMIAHIVVLRERTVCLSTDEYRSTVVNRMPPRRA